MLRYCVGVDAADKLIEFGEVWNRWSMLQIARANHLLPLHARVAAEKAWSDFGSHAFRSPMTILRPSARRLVLRNLAIDILTRRGSFLVGPRVLTPREAWGEVWNETPLADPLISLGRRFAQALVRTGGIDL